MRILCKLLTCTFLCVFLSNVNSQNLVVTYLNSNALFVCGTDTFTVRVQNVGPATVSGAALTVALPTGISYVLGTVAGANEQNVSNTQVPVYGLPDLLPGATATVTLLLTADCDAANALNAGQLFTANLTVTAGSASTQVTTSPIPLETGLLLIHSVDDALMSGERGDTLYRTICVKNTRLGPIGALHFEDQHQAGFDVAISGATSQQHDSIFTSAEFAGSFFTAFGDGDAFLELGEIACWTERIVITDCGEPEFTNPSMLRVGWGCGGSICQTDSLQVGIEIKKFTKNPNLVFTQIWSPPVDHCGDIGATMGLKINNTGKGDAENVLIHIRIAEKSLAGIGAGTFRIVDQNGTNYLPPNGFAPYELPACGLTVADSVTLIVPHVSAGDSLELLFDTYTCTTPCNQVLPSFLVGYFYRKPCPVNGFISDTLIITPDAAYYLSSTVLVNFGSCMVEDTPYPYTYTVISKRLTEADGFLRLDFVLPQGLTWSDDCVNTLGGVSPVSFSETPMPDQTTAVTLTFAMPLPNDSLEMGFCLEFACDSTIACDQDTTFSDIGGIVYAGDCPNICLVKMDYRATWLQTQSTPQPCGISACSGLIIGLDKSICTPDGGGNPPADTVVPYPVGQGALYRWKFNTYRLNFDLPDDNDDRTADGPGTANAPGVRRDRFLPGDTMRVEYCGYVDTGGGLRYFPRAIYHEIVRSDLGVDGTDAFLVPTGRTIFTNAKNFRLLHDSLRIRYADGSVFSCPVPAAVIKDQKYYKVLQINQVPPLVVDEIVTQNHRFGVRLDTLFAHGCLPKPTLDAGDSIFFYSDFKLDFNYHPVSNNNPDPPLVGFRTAFNHGGYYYAWNFYDYIKSQYSGYKTSRSNNTFSIKPCENSVEVKPFRYRLRIARENMFPYEVRPLGRIFDYYQSAPQLLNVVSAKLQYLVLQDSTPKLTDFPLGFTHQNGILDLDFDPVFSNPVDEGFSLATNIVFGPECTFARPDSSWQHLSVSFPPYLDHPELAPDSLNLPATHHDSLRNSIGFFSNHPQLHMQSPDTAFYITKRDFSINFSLRNLVIPPAANAWLGIVSTTGQSYDFELLQLPQQQIQNNLNGIFQLGNFSGFNTKNYLLRGENNYCEGDTLLLVYGWGCAPLAGLEEESCDRDTFRIVLLQERPQLELDPFAPDTITLCEESDYFEFEIYNAKTGFAYDLWSTVSLPPGLQIVPGSCQMSYPLGSPYQPIADPQPLPGNIYQWSINDLQAAIAANGLPGVNFDSLNAFRIRFRTLAECGFVANTQPVFGVRGAEPCGRSTNILNKPGNLLQINGLNPAYGVIVSLQPDTGDPNFCGGTQTFRVNLTLLGQPSSGDSIYVTLPQGVSLLAGSYQPGTNAPVGPPVPEASGFRIGIPGNLTNGSSLEFRFSVNFNPGAGCVNQLIRVQTRVQSEAFCATLGGPCSVYVATGEAALDLDLEHPELSVQSASVTLDGNQVSAGFNIQNIGTIPVTQSTVQIWRDMDGDNALSTGDVLLQTLNSSQPIDPGHFITLSEADLNVPPSSLCDLLLVLPAAENCTCVDQVFPVEGYSQTYDTQTACMLQYVPVGVPAQPGFSYQWQTPGGVACIDCATTTYEPAPGTPTGIPQFLSLAEVSDGCSILHQFAIVFGTNISAGASNSSICSGTPVTLTAQPNGATYLWSGTGIQNPGAQQQTLFPAFSTTYSVTVTLANGCTADTALAISVLPSDTTTRAALSTCQGVPVSIFGQMTDTPGLYVQIYDNQNGCDSVVLQALTVLPSPATVEALGFCQGDTLAVFDTLLTQSGQICRSYTGINGCDSVHCINVTAFDPPLIPDPDTIYGQVYTPIPVTGPNGYVSYVWNPADVNCIGCPAISPVFDSAGLYQYGLIVQDGNGCEGHAIYFLLIFPPCNAANVRIPNAFTPNGDGVNDVFSVVPYEGTEVVGSLTIFDRWGEKVYENSGNVFWDGTLDGKEAPADVYVYLIEILCGDTPERKIGNVTLLR